MASRVIEGEGFSEDTQEFIRLLARWRVRYLIVGGEAVIYHGYPRFTGDIDFFYENSAENARRLFAALSEFWADQVPGIVSAAELREPGVIFQFGRPPHRIDLLNRIDAVNFGRAWPNRERVRMRARSGFLPLIYIDAKSLLKNKRASARPKDQEDVRYLAAPRPKSKKRPARQKSKRRC